MKIGIRKTAVFLLWIVIAIIVLLSFLFFKMMSDMKRYAPQEGHETTIRITFDSSDDLGNMIELYLRDQHYMPQASLLVLCADAMENAYVSAIARPPIVPQIPVNDIEAYTG